MRARIGAALCALSLAAGLGLGFLAGRGRVDAELRDAVAEKKRILAELATAAEAVKGSGARLSAISAKMVAASDEAAAAAAAIADRAASVEVLVLRLKTYARDAKLRLRELSEELESAAGENGARVDELARIARGAGEAGQPR